MNSLIIKQPLTMTSREIAELTGKRHSDVLRDIDVIQDQLGDERKFAVMSGYMDSANRKQPMWILDYEETMILLTGYSVKLRSRVIARWQELEAKQTPQIPQSFAEALQLAADQAKQLELAAPKVAFVDNYVESGTTKTLRETAKILHYPERKMIAKLIDDKVLYRQSGNLLPYQDKHEQGLFEVKTGENGGYAFTQTRVTTKGIEWLAQRYASELL